MKNKKTTLFLPSLFLFLSLWLTPAIRSDAQELTPRTSGGGTSITVTAAEDSLIGAVYVKWDRAVSPYELQTDSETLSCGQNGFLHEFIALDNPSSALTFSLPAENPMKIYEIRIFTDNQVPEDVQIWEPPCERADILLVSAHADDEILFMGGIIPTYAAEQGARVQVVYMTEFWSTAPVREHEKLDGLWTDGLRTYPVCGNFKDMYAADLEAAEKIYDLDAMTDYLTETIQRFQPQILVTHDFNGEYGHGFHQLTARAAADALEKAADTWDVPKAYFHLYGENKIRLDLNVPLDSMNGQTALEAAKAAYLKHVSQQWCWFYVSDTYEYSCADFGLYRTNVGTDTTDNMLENIVLYSEQERIAAEEEQKRLEKEKAEAALEAELQQVDEQLAQLQKETQDRTQAAKEELAQMETELQKARRQNMLFLLGGGVLTLALLILLAVRIRMSGNSGKTKARDREDE